MRPGVRISLWVWLLTLLSVGALAQEKTLLTYKAQKGQVMRYKVELNLTMEAGGMKIPLEVKTVNKVTITDVSATGDITHESEAESYEVTVNGMKQPAPERDKTVSTLVYRADGTVVSHKTTAGEKDPAHTGIRLHAATTPVLSDKAVGTGDKWSKELKGNGDLGTVNAKSDYEVLGFEKVNGIDCVKIKMTYKEEEGSPAVAVNGTFWLEKASGDTVVADYELENFAPSGPQGPVANGKVHEERIEGSPVGAKPTPGGTTIKPEPKKEKNIDETVKEYEKLSGLFPIYRKKESGRETLYMEIREDQLDKLMMLQATASTGTSDQVVAGNPINDIVFKFVKVGDDKLFMVEPNIAFRANEKSPIARAVRRSFADGYLETFKIEATQADRKSLLINISDLFKGDIAQISQLFSGGGLAALLGGGGGASYSLDREKTYLSYLKNFPENLVVETAYHFQSSGRGGGLAALLGGGSTLADPRSAPFKVNYNLFALPDNGYKPRLGDPRVGYFDTSFQSFDDDSKNDTTIHYILRWNLEKSDPNAALSPPKKPIVFWLDNAIPLEYRDAVREGLLMWNKAFEKVGFKDAVVVKQMPDNADWDHADMRYNTIRWVASPDAGYAVALFRANPLTGQILNANITVDANFTRYIKLERKDLVNPAGFWDDPAPLTAQAFDPRRCEYGAGMLEQAWFGNMALSMLGGAGGRIDDRTYLHSYLREVVAHEMGHIMGLRHNFIASTYHSPEELKNGKVVQDTGCTASVMEYGPFNVFAIKQKGVDFYSSTVGPYDMWAIQYGYTPIASKTPEGELYKLKAIASRDNEPGLAYQTDENADQFDPKVIRFDLSKDPLAYWSKMLQVSRFLLFHLDERVPKKGESFWEFTRDFNRLLGIYSRAASQTSRYIGGLYQNRNHRGDPGEKPTLSPVSADEQKKALELLNTYIFAENAFAFPKRYFTRMTDNPTGEFNLQAYLNGGSTYPIRDQLASIQTAAIKRLFSPAVLSRVSNNEFKAETPSQALTLPYLFHSVRQTVWSELNTGKSISPLHRQLQRAHLDTLIGMVITPPAGAPDDAKMLAWDELRHLKSQIAQARRTHGDEYTRVHLDESLMRISRALDARQTLGGGGGASRGISLQDLLGGKTPQNAGQ